MAPGSSLLGSLRNLQAPFSLRGLGWGLWNCMGRRGLQGVGCRGLPCIKRSCQGLQRVAGNYRGLCFLVPSAPNRKAMCGSPENPMQTPERMGRRFEVSESVQRRAAEATNRESRQGRTGRTTVGLPDLRSLLGEDRGLPRERGGGGGGGAGGRVRSGPV